MCRGSGPHRLVVRTPPFQGGNAGSIPAGDAIFFALSGTLASSRPKIARRKWHDGTGSAAGYQRQGRLRHTLELLQPDFTARAADARRSEASPISRSPLSPGRASVWWARSARCRSTPGFSSCRAWASWLRGCSSFDLSRSPFSDLVQQRAAAENRLTGDVPTIETAGVSSAPAVASASSRRTAATMLLSDQVGARGRSAASPARHRALADRCRSRRGCRPTRRGRRRG